MVEVVEVLSRIIYFINLLYFIINLYPCVYMNVVCVHAHAGPTVQPSKVFVF